MYVMLALYRHFRTKVFSMFHASDKGDRRDDQCKGGGGGMVYDDPKRG